MATLRQYIESNQFSGHAIDRWIDTKHPNKGITTNGLLREERETLDVTDSGHAGYLGAVIGIAASTTDQSTGGPFFWLWFIVLVISIATDCRFLFSTRPVHLELLKDIDKLVGLLHTYDATLDASEVWDVESMYRNSAHKILIGFMESIQEYNESIARQQHIPRQLQSRKTIRELRINKAYTRNEMRRFQNQAQMFWEIPSQKCSRITEKQHTSGQASSSNRVK